MVHITGEVNNWGVIELEKGSRVIDAVDKAGGFTQDADTSKVNLAYVLEDAIKIAKGKNNEISEKKIDVAPYIVNGSTFIPLRGLLEEMGAEISWDGERQLITVKNNALTIELQIWNNTVWVTNSKVDGRMMYSVPNPPVISDNRTFVPVRFLSEILGYTVSWDGTAQTVTIKN